MATIKQLSLLILGFDEDSSPTQEQIKEAFKQASFKFHPDAGGSAIMFRGLVLAREVLSKKETKKEKTTQYYQTTSESEKLEELKKSLHVYVGLLLSLSRRKRICVKQIRITCASLGVFTIVAEQKFFGPEIKNMNWSGKVDVEQLNFLLNTVKWLYNQDSRKKFNCEATYDWKGMTLPVLIQTETIPWWVPVIQI